MRTSRIAAATGATLALGAGVAGAWNFGKTTGAVAHETCPAGALSPVPGPIDVTVGNTEPAVAGGKTDYIFDGTYGGQDADWRVKSVDDQGNVLIDGNGNEVLGPVQETVAVKAGEVAIAQLVGATYKQGENVKLVIGWKKDSSTHPLSLAVKVLEGAACNTPVPETTGTTTPIGETPVTIPGEVTETTPGTTSTIEKPKPKDSPSRIEVTKEDITYNGKTYIASNGEKLGRVRPGELFTTRVTAQAKDDGDKIKNETERTKVVINFPKAQNGKPGQYGYDPIKKEWVRRITRTVNLVEGGKAKVWNFKTKNTVDAAKPPQVLCNTATAWSEGRKKDTANDCIFDPMEHTLLAKRDSKLGRYVITIK